MEDIMTDYQFKTLLKMVLDIMKRSESLDDAMSAVEELIDDKKKEKDSK